MSNGQARLQWFGWLRSLLANWVSAKVVPSHHVLEELGINPAMPICYVLRSNSIFDFLMLDIFCGKVGLPRPLSTPDDLGSNKDAASVYLSQVGLLRTYGAYRNEPPSPFFKLLRRVSGEQEFDVQLVPVSVFWGRDPGSSDKSLFKLLFPDDERASFFQKAFIVLANGRNALVSFSRPIGLRTEYNQQSSIDQTARKLTRVVRVHFQNKRVQALGPGSISRNRVIETLIRNKHLRQAIEDESKKKGIAIERSQRLAKEYISEIAAEKTPQIIAGFAILLRRLWTRIYDGIQVNNIERVRHVPENAEIVYVPCHRSHMDYLLLNYVLYDHGEVTPHVAAGVNLNFWPVGSLLRRFGAFYIRRTFNNNRLYAVVFSEYVSFLLQRGAPLQFFLEGGRSRTGKLLHPKTGMVSMVFQSYMRSQSRPFYFLPVYIGYDNVMEVKSYRRELAGTKKQSESVGQLVKTRKALRRSHGQAYIGFGEPIDLGAFLDQEYPVWREQTYSLDSKPGWLSPAVNKLAFRVMKDINENAAVGPVAFTALILHASRTKAMAEEELVAHIELFLDILRRVPYSDSVRLPEIPARTIIERAEKFGRMNRFQHPGGDVIHLLEPQASYSIYVRNNIAHVFALPSLIAYFLQHNDHIADEFILRGCEMIYPVLKKEFFLRWESSEVRSVAKSYIEVFLELKLFERREDGLLTRPDVTRNEFTALRTLGLVIGAAVERYSVAVNLLHQYQGPGVFKAEEFQARCVMMAQRISLLTGATDSELPSAALFKVILDQLAEENHLEATSEGYRITPNFEQVYEVTSSLLSVDIRHSMSRVRK